MRFEDESIIVREDSSGPAMACFQICPAEMISRKRSASHNENGNVSIITYPRSANGIILCQHNNYYTLASIIHNNYNLAF